MTFYEYFILFLFKKKLDGTESWLTSSFTEPSHSAPTRLTINVSKNTLNLKYVFKNDLIERNLIKCIN